LRRNGKLDDASVKQTLRQAAADSGSKVVLPGDETSASSLGLDTRKMWFHWIGEKAFPLTYSSTRPVQVERL